MVQPFYSLGWTLNYEMAFYCVFAMFLGPSRRRAILATTAALVAIVTLGLLWASPPASLAFWGNPIVLEFAVGLWIGLGRAHGLTLPMLARVALGTVGLVLFSTVSLMPGWWPGSLLYLLPAGCLVAACGLASGASSVPAPERIAEALGDASYAIYLVHPFVIRPIRQAFGIVLARSGTIGAGWEPLFLALALVATALAALVVHRFVDRPLTRAFRRLLEPTRPMT